MAVSQETRDRLTYAFGHIVGAEARPDDAHAVDSRDLAEEVLSDLILTVREKELVNILAEHVAGNYQYTGEADKLAQDIAAGRV